MTDINFSPLDNLLMSDSPTGSNFSVLYISRRSRGMARLLGNLQTLSVSTHTELYPVRRLGQQAAAEYARGIRTVAGTMIFLMQGNDPFLEEYILSQDLVNANGVYEYRRTHIELIPPFDLIVQAVSEIPSTVFGTPLPVGTKMFIGGLQLAETGLTLSVHDLYTEVMYSWVAQWVEPFRSTSTTDQILEAVRSKPALAQSVDDLYTRHQADITQYLRTSGKIDQ